MAKTIDELYQEADAGYQEAAVIPRFTPPDDQYSMLLSDVVEFTSRRNDGSEELVVILVGTILDGDYADQRSVICRSGNTTRGMLKEAAEIILGKSTSMKQDVAALKQAAQQGVVLSVEYTTRVAKNGNSYTNPRILERQDAEVADAESEAAAE